MNKNYVIISVSDYKDLNGASRTVHCGEVQTVSPGAIAVTPMISYTFTLSNPSSADLASYDVGKNITLTIAPTVEATAEPAAS